MNPNRLTRLRVDLADAQDGGTPVKIRPVDLAELLSTLDAVHLLRAEAAQHARISELDREHINKLEAREVKLRARIDELETPTNQIGDRQNQSDKMHRS